MISTDYSEEEVAALDGRRSEGACATYGYPEFEQPMKNKRADPLRSKDIREISQGRPARSATLDEKYQRSGLFGKVQGAGRAGSGTV
jgi:hypothetical protein